MCDKLKRGFNVLELSVFFGYFDENVTDIFYFGSSLQAKLSFWEK